MILLAPWAEGFADWLIRASWQGSIIALLIVAATRLGNRRLAPTWRYRLWYLLVLRLVFPGWPPSSFSVFNWVSLDRAGASLAGRAVSAFGPAPSTPFPPTWSPPPEVHPASLAQPAPEVASDPLAHSISRAASPLLTKNEKPVRGSIVRWPVWAGGVWLAGVLLLGTRMLAQEIRLRRSLRHQVPVRSREVLALLDTCREILGVRRPVTLIETEAVGAPAVHGVRRPRLLVPDGLFERLSPRELRHVFLHELAHVRRRDLELNSLLLMLGLVHWFNPVLQWAFRRLRADRELATDELALTHLHGDSPVAYGETLLTVLENAPVTGEVLGQVGIGEDRAQIESRLRAIAAFGRRRFLPLAGAILLAGLAAVALTDPRPATPLSPAQPGRTSAAADHSDIADAGSAAVLNERPVEVAVRREPGGGFVDDAEVVVEREMDGQPPETLRLKTDARGRATFILAPSRTSRLTVWVELPDLVAPKTEWLKQQVTGVPAEITLPVREGLALGGRVTDAQGRPVAGAEILHGGGFRMILSSAPAGSTRSWAPPPGTPIARTDGDGRWLAGCVWPEVTLADLRVRKSGFALGAFSTQTTAARERAGDGHHVDWGALREGRAQLVLDVGSTLEGRVLDLDGTPRAGAKVRYSEELAGETPWDASVGSGTVASGVDGRFVISDLNRTRVHLVVQESNRAPAAVVVDLRAASAPTEIRLTAATRWKGRVVDRAGRPLPGVRLRLVNSDGWQGLRWEDSTDGEGVFRWSEGPASPLSVRFEKPGYPAVVRTFDPSGDLLVRLDEALLVEGSVVDAKTGEPVKSCRIYWADRPEMLRFRRALPLVGSNGRYRIDASQLYDEIWSEGYPHRLMFRIEAEGYAAWESRTFEGRSGDVGRVVEDVRLEPVPRLRVRVRDAEGRPVAGAQLAFVSPKSRLRLAGRATFEPLDGTAFPVTDAEGQAQITPDVEATDLVTAHERGIAWVPAPGLPANREVELALRPWARVEGVAVAGTEPVPGAEVVLMASPFQGSRGPTAFTPVHQITQTDAQGRFALEHLPPGTCTLFRMLPMGSGSASGPQESLTLDPGVTASVRLGGRGRPVVGRMKVLNPYVAVDWQEETWWIHTARPKGPPTPGVLDRLRAWWDGPAVPAEGNAFRSLPMRFAADGSFQIDDVEPGDYEFQMQVRDPNDREARAFGRYIGAFQGRFKVPSGADQNSAAALDLGEFEMRLRPETINGQTQAPEFSGTDLAGKEFRLSELRGRYVLLDFWATWCGPCLAELPRLREVHRRFGQRQDFVMVSLSIDDRRETVARFVANQDLPWQHLHLGSAAESTVPGAYGVAGIPALFLIDPEGRIVASGLRGPDLEAELAKWLEPPRALSR